MALEINASKVVNTVTFKVDTPALNEAKKAIKSVKDYAEGLQPSLDMSKFKRQMREMESYAKRARKAARESVNGAANPAPTPAPPGAGTKGSGARGPGRGGSGNTGGRAATAALRRENFNYRSAQFSGASDQIRAQSLKIVNDMVAAYEREEVSVSRLNQTIAHQLDTLRQAHREKMAQINEENAARRAEERELQRIARLNQRIADREEAARAREARRSEEQARRERDRRLERFRDNALSLNARGLVGGLIGAAAFEGVSRIRENLSQTAERNNLVGQGAKNVQANPNAILALSTWGAQNGVDSANVKKAIDNLKDVRERLGNSAMNSTLDPKTGKYKGGDSGINDIMNQFGWTPDMIKKYQNNPLDFIGATVNEGQRRGMNSAQIGRLMENLGDDLMHYQRMFENSGEGFKQTLDELTRTGAALSDSQIDAAHRYTTMAGELGLISEGWSNKLLDGFMSGIDPNVMKEFQKTLIDLGPQVQDLGHFIGETTNNLMRFVDWLAQVVKGPLDKAWTAAMGTRQVTNSSGQYYDDSPIGSLVNGVRGMLGFDTGSNLPGDVFNRANPLASIPASSIGGSWTPASLSSGLAMQQGSVMTLSPQIVLPSDLFTVNVTPSSTFGDIIEATMDQKVAFNHQSLILDMNSSTSATGSN